MMKTFEIYKKLNSLGTFSATHQKHRFFFTNLIYLATVFCKFRIFSLFDYSKNKLCSVHSDRIDVQNKSNWPTCIQYIDYILHSHCRSDCAETR